MAVTHRLAPLLALLAIAGCSGPDAEPVSAADGKVATTATATAPVDDHEGHNHAPGEGHEGENAQPPAGMGGQKIPEPSVSDTDLKTMEGELAKTVASGDKKAASEAATALGNAVMQSGQPPRTMYKTALGHFRQAVELDPSNAKAKEWIGMIEGIYRQMNRPVPK